MEKTISSKIVFRCPIFKVEEVVVELTDGTKEKRWYVVKKPAVGVFAFDSKRRLLLLKEFRSALGGEVWRIPAGGVGRKESPRKAAQRELREETGFRAGSLTLLKKTKNPSAYIKQTLYFFLGRNLKRNPLPRENGEFIKLVPVSLARAVVFAKQGKIKSEMAEIIFELARSKKDVL